MANERNIYVYGAQYDCEFRVVEEGRMVCTTFVEAKEPSISKILDYPSLLIELSKLPTEVPGVPLDYFRYNLVVGPTTRQRFGSDRIKGLETVVALLNKPADMVKNLGLNVAQQELGLTTQSRSVQGQGDLQL